MLRFHTISSVVAAVLGVALMLMGAGPASASSAGSNHRLSRCTASGQFATCVTSGTTGNYPTSIHVHVKSSHPGEQVFASWDVTCAKGSGAGSRSGSETANTIINKKIKLPYTHPDYCIVSADAQLQKGGSWIEVYISYWT